MSDMETIKQQIKDSILNDESYFQTIEDDYEVINRNYSQIMRMLRALPGACSGNQIDMDAITSALSFIEKDLDRAVEREARMTVNHSNEMAAFGEE